MTDPRSRSRRRPHEGDEQPTDASARPTSPDAASTHGIRSVRVERSSAPSEPMPPVQRTSGLMEDDLLALADMDRSELAALMDGAVRSATLEVGDKVRGVVARIAREGIFVDVGAKAEGQIALEELPDAKPGDQVEAWVLALGEWGLQLSTRLSGPAAAVFVEEAHASGIPVEGKVVSRNPGGFEVRIGTVWGFCPISLMDRLLTEDLDAYLGQTFQFKVIETGDKLVLSRRELQEEQLDLTAAWNEVLEGQLREGTIASVQDFGVFVDLDGIQGLVHRSELGWDRVEDPKRHFKRGQPLQVRVLEVDRERKRLSLSAKDPDQSPWLRASTIFPAGSVHVGTVKRVEPYGAFVELMPGLQGLLHVSNVPRGQLPGIGEAIDVTVLEVDLERRRIGLSAENLRVSGAEDIKGVGAQVSGTAVDVLRNGVVVDLDDGRTGWLPAREVELPAGTVLAQRYRRGRPVTARVLEDDAKRNRVVLTTRSGQTAGEAAWASTQSDGSGAGGSSQGFGTFADLLKKKPS